jgi:hypothetical protein
MKRALSEEADYTCGILSEGIRMDDSQARNRKGKVFLLFG